VVGVSPDSQESHRKFIKKHNITVELLCDPDTSMIKAYDAWGKKQMYGKEYEGVIRSSVLIDPEGVLRAHWPKVSPKGHAQEVLERLEAVAGPLP
jgi:thioredoxin-dependent peroxiredoxin